MSSRAVVLSATTAANTLNNPPTGDMAASINYVTINIKIIDPLPSIVVPFCMKNLIVLYVFLLFH